MTQILGTFALMKKPINWGIDMGEIKTKKNDSNVDEFIKTFGDTDKKRSDAFALLKIMQNCTGYTAKMWGSSIVGFGEYHYKSERSSQEGDWPLVGFSPRKAAISLYVYSGGEHQDEMLQKLGKFKMGKSCIYIKKLEDINMETLEALIISTIDFLQTKYKYG